MSGNGKNLKERFYKVYSNVPVGVRREVVIVIDERPINWDVAFIEVDNDTKLSNRILSKLEKLEII